MLKYMRKKGFAKKILWFVAIVIIIAFGFGGTAYMLRSRSMKQYAGEIFGRKISLSDFFDTLAQVRIRAMMQYGDKFNQVAPFLDLDTETWDRLILLHEAKKQRIKASNEEVIETIQQYPFFQRNNKFDTTLYNNILRGWLRIKPRNFEEHTRDTIIIGKLYNKITSDITVSEKDVLDKFERDNEKAQATYALISTADFVPKVNFNESEAIKFFEANKYSFTIPPTINIEYINIPLNEDASDTDKEKAMDKANDIYYDLSNGSDFAKTAKESGLEVKSTGFFSSEKPNLSLGWSYETLNKVLGMGVGDIIEPFESQDGVKIAKVKAKRDAYVPEYEEVKKEVKETVLKNAANKIAKEKAKEYLKEIQSKLAASPVKNFSKAAKVLGLDINQTPEFNRGEYLPNIGLSKEFQEAAFSLKEKQLFGNVVKTAKGYCILFLDSYVPADKTKFEEQKQKLAEDMLLEKRNKAFNDFMTSLRAKANLKDNIAKLREQQRQ